MIKTKLAAKRVLLAFVVFFTTSFLAVFLSSAPVFAEPNDTSGIITDNNNIRWEYSLTDNNSNLAIRFYDKPESLDTVTVPSLSELISLVPNAPANLDTYILENADTEAQNTNFPSETRRTPSVETVKLDMTNTSKIQIHGVSPIVNPEVETELVFGENMVIGDVWTKQVTASVCTSFTYYPANSWSDAYYYCYPQETVTFTNFDELIPGWTEMSVEEKTAYDIEPEDLGYIGTANWSILESNFDPNARYMIRDNWTYDNKTRYEGGAFSGYKLKLTNFVGSNFNYVGFEAFKDSVFNEANTSITISGPGFNGQNIFQNTNIKSVVIDTDKLGTGIFKDCDQLTDVAFTENATRISDDMFAGTSITSLDFSTTNIKTIGARAFEGSKIESVDFTGIQRINYAAFRHNDIKELYLPESINYLESGLFYGNGNLKKVTIAYDTMTSGTTLPFFVVLDSGYNGTNDRRSPCNSIEEINVIAPYADGESLSATHVTYDDYRWHYDPYTQEHVEGDDVRIDHSGGSGYGWLNYTYYERDISDQDANNHATYKFEDDYANVDSYKNVLAPDYFMAMHNLKKIYIGDGYEFIGSSAFWNMPDRNDFGYSWNNYSNIPDDGGQIKARRLDEIRLPEGLKGVGNLAFESNWSADFKCNLPESLEFIGMGAFRRNWNLNIDFYLPNLKYLGDYAFETTRLKNITLNDKIFYMGQHVFSNIPTIEDITIDFDIFNPDLMITWVNPDYDYDSHSIVTSYDISTGKYTLDVEKTRKQFMNYFKKQFGEWYGSMWAYTNQNVVNKWGIKREWNELDGVSHQKFDKITFTSKAVHEIPCTNYELDNDIQDNYTRDVFFGYIIADEVDISATPWKVLPRNTFKQTKIDTIKLPQNLEVIGTHAFNAAEIKNELELPDTVKIIGDRAFESYRLTEDSIIQSGVQHGYEVHTPIIKKLPSSLEYIGIEAFYGDSNLEADLNAPNLKHVGIRAFQGTKLRDVLIPEYVTSLSEGTFENIPTLRNITIDADFGAIVGVDGTDEAISYPQSLSAWAGSDYSAKYAVKSRSIESCMNGTATYLCSDYESWDGGKDFETIYTIFNQTMKVSNPGTNDGQLSSGERYGVLSFGPKNTTDISGNIGIFSGLTFEKVDMSKAGWKNTTNATAAFYKSKIGTLLLPENLENISDSTFMYTEVENPFELPSTLNKISRAAFQWSKVNILNALPEGLKTIEGAAFYSTDFTDDLVIPSTVTSIGYSAFNAGDADVHYDTITIKPDLTYSNDSNQLIHQLFWNADMDKMIIESRTLPALNKQQNGEELLGYEQEFYSLPFDEVVLKNVPGITRQAFVNCENLVRVDASENSSLRAIDEEAFLNDTKLHIFNFSPEIKNETVTVGKNAFNGTAFETMGDSSKEFDLTAAHFDGSDGYAFANMPKLKTVDVPATYSNATIPRASFYNDPELTEATVAYQITDIKNAAFANDNKLERIFIWGDTIVEDKNIGGYTMPTRAPDDTVGDGFGPTIPAPTDIYAYSVNLTESYAAFEGRNDFEGTFYPLDEVIYLTSNHPRVILNDDQDDFDKSNLVVYGLRRDGIVLESDSWGEFDGTAYPRSAKNLTFDRMPSVMDADPVFGAIHDTPVPINLLNFGNENFDEIDFDLIRDDEDSDIRLVNIIYTDAYTRGEPDTDIDPNAIPDDDPISEIFPDSPFTGDQIVGFAITLTALSISAIVLLIKKKY